MATCYRSLARQGNLIKVLVALGLVFWLLIIVTWKYESPFVSTKEPIFQRTLNRVRKEPGEFCLVSYNILYDQAIIKYPDKYFPLSMEEKLKKPNPKTSLRHVQLMKEVGKHVVALHP